MEIIDRKLWERELTEHMRQHASDLRDARHAQARRGVWFSAPKLALWTVTVMVLTSGGWVIGLYFI